MAFIGATIQGVKGGTEKLLNIVKLKRLRKLDNADLFDLIPEEKHIPAKILLKQTEHQRLVLNNAERKQISKIEKEILNLMEENINKKKDELKKINATQLDIANILLTIQQLSHETIEEHHKLKDGLNNKLMNMDDKLSKMSDKITDMDYKINKSEKKQKQISYRNYKFTLYLSFYCILLSGLLVYLFIIIK